MSTDTTNDENDVSSLPTLFAEGLKLFNNLEKIDEPTNTLDVQIRVKRCIKIFEKATILCSYAGVFSSNEDYEEIATADLQYFLLPALLGSLHLKLTSGERNNIVEVCDAYFTDFMKRCVDYGLCSYDFKRQKPGVDDGSNSKEPLSEMEELTVLAKRRADKIKRYNEQQQAKRLLNELEANLKKDHVDDHMKREYFTKLIQFYCNESINELDSLEFEKVLLKHMATLKKSEQPKPMKRPPAPLKPIIITKDVAQKAVFGAGYPSMPSMTVQEFYDKRIKDGVFPDPSKLKINSISLQDAAMRAPAQEPEQELSEEIDTDDYHILEAMRQRDEFKDTHRRGWGNRMNRS
ncbi:immunoglobulin-binding protein 1b-like [Coccinella septempunctata]|uniref:immunoglobulin-binding protein 1b-like n=1 Tax=Coccinella septempunctata TaxID=41139 RepID=UPI001D0667C0|nr:immunoglobulin-binding protein 1b-like [Coccinella septempunctata]